MAESLYKCAGIPPLPGVEKKQKHHPNGWCFVGGEGEIWSATTSDS